jgi:hypothetical protein
MSAKWWVHLGFQPDSAYIGQVWDNIFGTSIASKTYHFLQYALAKNSSGQDPAWFNFQTGDQLYFFIWNLGSSSSWSPRVLSMCCSDINSAVPYDSSTYLKMIQNSNDHGTPKWSFMSSKYVSTQGFEPPYMSSKCPWGPATTPCQMTAGGVEFQESVTCKLSFFLVTEDTSQNTQAFISDPEVIVGSKGT